MSVSHYGEFMVSGVNLEDGFGALLVSMRFRDDDPSLLAPLHDALAAFGAFAGFERGYVARSIDEVTLLTLTMIWRDVGSYRRALSNFDIKVTVVPLLSRAIDEPSAFEVVTSQDDSGAREFTSSRAADAHEVSLGEAAAGRVPPQR